MNNFLLGKQVLVVEDEMMILMMFEDMLADLGCKKVLSASTVDQALELINTYRVDAATLDVNLCGSDSYPIADSLTARSVPFAFVTSYGPQGLRKDYSHHTTLKKPFTSAEFTEMLRLLVSETKV
ncbi:response regulator [Alcaligenaceae bacterium CGII-47]|nr:response regulator [Alcaligenaceae bacterium CGII-47]